MRTTNSADDSPDPTLRAITRAVTIRDAAAESVDEAVQAARAAGHPWEAIAVALGVSRQAAQQRYSELDNLPAVESFTAPPAGRRVRGRYPGTADGLGVVTDEEIDAFGDWLISVRGIEPKPASDYRSRLRRALSVDVTTLGDNVQADIRTAVRAFHEFRVTR